MEQPLPPYGACLLGSFNLVKYIKDNDIDYVQLVQDIPSVVRAMDNVVDEAIYPLPQQEVEAKNKRRMGLGVTGFANALEKIGFEYGTDAFLDEGSKILETLKEGCYQASAYLAKEKGAFPLFDDRYLSSKFIQSLTQETQYLIKKYGIRNSHLISIAPTGTISLSADNVSSGIEPVFTHSFTRTIQTFEGPRHEEVSDFAYREWGVLGKKASEVPVEDHVKVLCMAQKHVDSACSKTCNVGDDVTWDRFKDVYMQAYDQGAKGCTTFRAAGKRYGILNETEKEYVDDEDQVQTCSIDTTTGQPTCS